MVKFTFYRRVDGVKTPFTADLTGVIRRPHSSHTGKEWDVYELKGTRTNAEGKKVSAHTYANQTEAEKLATKAKLKIKNGALVEHQKPKARSPKAKKQASSATCSDMWEEYDKKCGTGHRKLMKLAKEDFPEGFGGWVTMKRTGAKKAPAKRSSSKKRTPTKKTSPAKGKGRGRPKGSGTKKSPTKARGRPKGSGTKKAPAKGKGRGRPKKTIYESETEED